MAVIYSIISLIVLSILYYRMIVRETPSPVEKVQAVVPVLVGVLSTPFSFMLFLGLGFLILNLGFTSTDKPLLIRSIIGAMFAAGIPEEVAKMLLMLLLIFIFRSKLRNVYEYILIGAAVGFGFTILEEYIYAPGSITDVVGRIITIAGHMAFGIMMAEHLGLAKYYKVKGEPAPLEYVKAFVYPFIVHTLYDAFTADNHIMESEDAVTSVIGICCAFAAIILLFIFQIYVLIEFKKGTGKYCALKVK